jgi:cytidine deaminase
MTPVVDLLSEALDPYSPTARPVLGDLVLDPSFGGVVSSGDIGRLATALGVGEPEVPLALVPLAACYAMTPISRFRVGGVGIGSTTGDLYFGANLEFPGAALSMSVHAEQAVTTNAWLRAEEGLTAIAVSALPCGYCRQFLYELTTAEALQIVTKKHGTQPLTDLLHLPFGPEDLHKTERLMAPDAHDLELFEPNDAVVLAALEAANLSYAPYSAGFAGVALETTNRDVFAGRYAENAAFNPSMSPLASALAMWSLDGARDPVIRAVLVQVASPVDHVGVTELLLEVVAPVALEVYTAATPPPEPLPSL